MCACKSVTESVAIAATLLEAEDWSFTTQLDRSSVTIYSDDDLYHGSRIAEIEWSTEFELRNWGIKDVSIHIKKLWIRAYYEKPTNDDGDYDEIPYDIRYPAALPAGDRDNPDEDLVTAMAEPEWTIRTERDFNGFMVAPHTVEVDLRKRVIRVLF